MDLPILILLPLLALALLPLACAQKVVPFSGQAKIYVEEDGIVRLSHSLLRDAGVDLSGVDPARIQLTHRGQEIPIRIVGDSLKPLPRGVLWQTVSPRKGDQLDSQSSARPFATAPPQDGSATGSGRGHPSVAKGEELAIEFYGTASKSRYSVANVYWLTVGQAAGKRMAERPASPGEAASFPSSFWATLHREEDLLYWSKAPPGADHWCWQSLTAPSSATFTFDLRHLADGEGTLRVTLLGGSRDAVEPDHHVRIHLNGHLLADATWDGMEETLVEVAIPPSVLLEGENTLALEAPGDTGARADVVLLDGFEIGYRRRFIAEDDRLQFEGDAGAYRIAGFSQPDVEVFDITDPANVLRLTGLAIEREGDAYTVSFSDDSPGLHTVLAVSPRAMVKPARIALPSGRSLRAADRQADYIVITHPNLQESLEPLVTWRESQGLRVVVATIEEVYDEFSHGLAEPAAIRDFLRYAHEHWAKPAPRYVLLVGDASYDLRDNLKAPNKSLVPTYLVQTHFVGETASDNWFVDLDDDGLPDMAIGRLPVGSAAEARAVVEKIVGYERSPAPGKWRRRALFVADDDQPAFEATSDDLIESYLPSEYEAIKVTLSAFADPEESRARIVEVINEGVALVNYIGHAALDVWAKERVFASQDIASLRNGARLPFVVTMTCLDGYFHHPQVDCLAEELLLAEGKGAVAVLAPTSESLPGEQDVLAKALFEALFAGDAPTLGEAIMRAKRSLPDGGRGYEDLIETYTLLGDPALRLR
ncbi:MAG TPA: hypothetical protein EYP55_01710 [Anaerolineae bacterium]|nr:hypothetical protein [Anaerolineae bacterium]